jgi:hypothetical protein
MTTRPRTPGRAAPGRIRPKRVYAPMLVRGLPAAPRRSYAAERARRLLGLALMLAGGLVAASHVLQLLSILALPFLPADWHLIAYPVAAMIVIAGAVLAGGGQSR